MTRILRFITEPAFAAFILLSALPHPRALALDSVTTLVGYANDKRCYNIHILSEDQARAVEQAAAERRLDREIFRVAFHGCLSYEEAVGIARDNVNKPFSVPFFENALWRKGKDKCGRKDGLTAAQAVKAARDVGEAILDGEDFFFAFDRCVSFEESYKIARLTKSTNIDRGTFRRALWFSTKNDCPIRRVIPLGGAERLALDAHKGLLYPDFFFYKFENCGRIDSAFQVPPAGPFGEQGGDIFYRLLWRRNGLSCKNAKSISWESAEKITRAILERGIEESLVTMSFDNCLTVEDALKVAEKSKKQKTR